MEQNRPGQSGSQTGNQTPLSSKDWQNYMQAIEYTNPQERQKAIKAFTESLARDGKLETFVIILEEVGQSVDDHRSSGSSSR